MKVMTLASAIDDGVFNPNEVISTINGITVADTTINDWNVNEGMTSVQYLTYAQGFAWSSNVAMTSLEQKWVMTSGLLIFRVLNLVIQHVLVC